MLRSGLVIGETGYEGYDVEYLTVEGGEEKEHKVFCGDMEAVEFIIQLAKSQGGHCFQVYKVSSLLVKLEN